jgi:hypothetical protein
MKHTPIFMENNIIMFSTKGISFTHMQLWIIRVMLANDFAYNDDYHLVVDTGKIEYPVSRDKLSTSWDWHTNIKVVMRSTEGYVMMKLRHG